MAVPDWVVAHFPPSCGRCALPLGRDAVAGDVVRRQVFDVPEAGVEVTEHSVATTAAHAMIAETGVDMTRFPTAGHLASWAKFAPGVKESAGKSKGTGATGHGNPYLAWVLGEAAVGAARTDTFLGERYRRIARRRGKKKAVVAVGRSILVIVWHLLADKHARFADLGPDHYDTRAGTHHAVRDLHALGYQVTLHSAA